MKTLTAAENTALALPGIFTKQFVAIYFDTPAFLTDHHRDVTTLGENFIASAGRIKITPIKESGEIRVNRVTLELSGIGSSFRYYLMVGGHIDRRVVVYRGLFSANDDLISPPRSVFDGRWMGDSFEEGGASSRLTIDLASHFADWDKLAGRLTNSNSQQEFFPNDTSMDLSGDSVIKVPWGRTG